MTDTCVLIRCSQPILSGEPSVTLSDGGKIHMECVFEWQCNGGLLRRHQEKKDE